MCTHDAATTPVVFTKRLELKFRPNLTPKRASLLGAEIPSPLWKTCNELVVDEAERYNKVEIKVRMGLNGKQ